MPLTRGTSLAAHPFEEVRMGWILALGAVIAAIVTGLTMPVAPVLAIARVFFLLFLVALIAAGVRSATRGRRPV